MTALIVPAAIGLVIGLVLGALGGGGGVLTVPALVYLLAEPAHAASAASLVIVGIAALAGLPAHARSGNVRWGAGLLFGAVGTVAAAGGTLLARHLDGDVLLLVFAAVILVSATLMFRDARRSKSSAPTQHTAVDDELSSDMGSGAGSSSSTRSATAVLARPDTTPTATTAPRSRAALVVLVVLGGTAVGLLTGLFGVGGGFLAVPVLLLVMRWSMPAAVGTSLLVIVINSGAALVLRSSVETFDWAVIVPVTVAAVVGVVLGKLVTDRVSGPRLSSIFAVMLVLLAVYTGIRSGFALLG